VLQSLYLFVFFSFWVNNFFFHQQIGNFWFFFSVNSTNVAIFFCCKCLPNFLNHKIGKKNHVLQCVFSLGHPINNALSPPPKHTHTHTHPIATSHCDKQVFQWLIDGWFARNSIKCEVLHLICGIATQIYPRLPKNTTQFGS
jgi:hypothetical protein